jgi:hypothetical protein
VSSRAEPASEKAWHSAKSQGPDVGGYPSSAILEARRSTMIFRPVLPFCRAALLSALVSGAVLAQSAPTPPEPEGGRVFCQQSVSYRLADQSTVPEPYRRFLGAWSDASWDANTCAALIVDDVRSDGAASIIYVFGPMGSSARVPGGVLHGTGIIRDDELRFQNSDGTQFAFRPAIADLVGRMTTPQGQTYQAEFKKTF